MIQLTYDILDPQRLLKAHGELVRQGWALGIEGSLGMKAVEVLTHLDALALSWGRGICLEEVGLEVVGCWVQEVGGVRA